MKRSVFSYTSYKVFMSDTLLGGENRGELTRAADAIQCQRSFLSRVISTEIHLTRDFAFRLCDYWSFVAEEREFFFTLVDYERAGDEKYRNFLKQQIELLKKNQEKIELRVKRSAPELKEFESQYFSSWIWSAIHFLTSIPAFQTVESLQTKLNLPRDVVLQVLSQLAKVGFVSHQQGQWVYQTGEFHTGRESIFSLAHHQNWSQRAMIHAQLPLVDNIHFTNLQTVSVSDLGKIKELLLDFISKTAEIAKPSSPEEAFVMNIDFFKL